MREDERKQRVVEALPALPVPRLQSPQRSVARQREQTGNDDERPEPEPVREAEAVRMRHTTRRDEVVEDRELAVDLEPVEHVDTAEDGRPDPDIAPEVGRDRIASSE